MKAILGMLALLALAGAASANYAPWYYHTMYKWRCYVPGCDEVCKRRSDTAGDRSPFAVASVSAVTQLATAS
jgi:hypothetical protein